MVTLTVRVYTRLKNFVEGFSMVPQMSSDPFDVLIQRYIQLNTISAFTHRILIFQLAFHWRFNIIVIQMRNYSHPNEEFLHRSGFPWNGLTRHPAPMLTFTLTFKTHMVLQWSCKVVREWSGRALRFPSTSTLGSDYNEFGYKELTTIITDHNAKSSFTASSLFCTFLLVVNGTQWTMPKQGQFPLHPLHGIIIIPHVCAIVYCVVHQQELKGLWPSMYYTTKVPEASPILHIASVLLKAIAFPHKKKVLTY